MKSAIEDFVAINARLEQIKRERLEGWTTKPVPEAKAPAEQTEEHYYGLDYLCC